MNIYLLNQSERRGYDTYDSCVVVAENEEEARKIRPDLRKWGDYGEYSAWANKLESVKVTLLGTAAENTTPGIICSSFNAG